MPRNILTQKAKVVFIITGVFVGILVTAQFRSAIPTSSFKYDELHAQQELIKSYTSQQTALKNKIVLLRQQIQQKQDQAGTSVEKTNVDLLNQLKEEVGLSTLQGEGIEIILNDNTRDKNISDQNLIHAADLRDVANALLGAGAQAVSINGQRIINSTTINAIGNTILVNNSHLVPPFKIKAVGDPEILENRFKNLKLLPDLKKRFEEGKIEFSLATKQLLAVPFYTSDFRIRFIQGVSEEIGWGESNFLTALHE